MTWNGKLGNDLVAEGQATPKPPGVYKIVGQSPPRFDVPAKVFGKLDYVTDIKVPGMLHGRMIRPPVAGAVPVAVDENSTHDIPGVRVVHDKGFIGIVADREWDAVQAAERLAVKWSKPPPPFPEMTALYDHIRAAPVVKGEAPVCRRDRAGFRARGADCRSGIRVAVPIACQHGSGLRRRRRAGRWRDVVDGLAEAAFRTRRSRSCVGPASGQGARDLGPGSGLLWSQRRRRCRDGCGAAFKGDRPAGARPGHALRGAWLGPQRAGFDPPRPRGA